LQRRGAARALAMPAYAVSGEAGGLWYRRAAVLQFVAPRADEQRTERCL